MFGISFAELAVIFVVALLLFGPEKLPELAHTLGKLLAQLKQTSDQLRDEFYEEFSAPVRHLTDELKDAGSSDSSRRPEKKGAAEEPHHD